MKYFRRFSLYFLLNVKLHKQLGKEVVHLALCCCCLNCVIRHVFDINNRSIITEITFLVFNLTSVLRESTLTFVLTSRK